MTIKRKSLYNNKKIKYKNKYKDDNLVWIDVLRPLLDERKNDKYFLIDREINEELFYYILEPILKEMERKGLFAVKNDVFYLYNYDWSDEEGYGINTLDFPNFYHKPSGLRIKFYKYPLRGSYSNIKITPKKLRAVLYDCLDSWISTENCTFSHLQEQEKWWLKKLNEGRKRQENE